MDEWSLATDQGEVRALVIYKGAIHITRAGRTAATRPISYDRHDIPADATWDNRSAGAGAGVAWNHLGFWKIESRPALPTLARALALHQYPHGVDRPVLAVRRRDRRAAFVDGVQDASDPPPPPRGPLPPVQLRPPGHTFQMPGVWLATSSSGCES